MYKKVYIRPKKQHPKNIPGINPDQLNLVLTWSPPDALPSTRQAQMDAIIAVRWWAESLVEKCKEQEQELLKMCAQGHKIPGYKPAITHAGKRAWMDEDTAKQCFFTHGLDESEVLSLRSPYQMEQQGYGDLVAELQKEGVVTNVSPTVKLVPEKNWRPAISAKKLRGVLASRKERKRDKYERFLD